MDMQLKRGLLDVCVARPVPTFGKLLPILMKYKAGKHIEDKDDTEIPVLKNAKKGILG